MALTFLDLFSGVGGFRFGMEQAGHKCLGYVEIDSHARKSYEAIHQTEGEWSAHDITKVNNKELRKFRGKIDVICGGFPCQAFSNLIDYGNTNRISGLSIQLRITINFPGFFVCPSRKPL